MGKGGGESQTIQKADPWSGVQPFLTGTGGTTTRRLRQGVTPIYAPGSEGGYLSFNDWGNQNPDQLDPEGLDWNAYNRYKSEAGNQVYANPESDYETITEGGTPGIYPEAARIYGSALDQGYIGQTARQEDINKDVAGWFGAIDPYQKRNIAEHDKIFSGEYDPTLGPIRDINARGTNLSAARAAQGQLDPTNAMSGILSGQIDTTGLDALQQAATNRAMVGYGDAVTDAGRMFSEQIAPSIRGGAQVAGQYGGSRQGIAEGIAARGMSDQLGRSARDLGLASMDVGTQLYGDAARRAQEQKYGMAGLLGNQSFEAQKFDIGNDMESQRLNQAADQARNIQEMARQAQRLSNLQTGMGMGTDIIQQQAGIYDTLYGVEDRARADQQGAQQYPWDQLNRYASIVTPGAGIGGTTTQTGDDGGGFSVGGALGGALTGGGLASSMGLLGGAAGMTNPLGWATVLGSGLLGGLR